MEILNIGFPSEYLSIVVKEKGCLSRPEISEYCSKFCVAYNILCVPNLTNRKMGMQIMVWVMVLFLLKQVSICDYELGIHQKVVWEIM